MLVVLLLNTLENYSVCCALCVTQTDRQADSSSEDIILCAHCQYRFLTDRPGVLALENLLAVHYWGEKKKKKNSQYSYPALLLGISICVKQYHFQFALRLLSPCGPSKVILSFGLSKLRVSLACVGGKKKKVSHRSYCLSL